MNRATKRQKPPSRTYDLELTGQLAGYHVTMGAMTGANIIALRSGELPEHAVIQMIADRMVSHDFDVDSPLDLDYWILIDIMGAWGRAMEERAVPPASGES